MIEPEEDILLQLNQPQKRAKAFSSVVRPYQERLYWHIRKMVLSHEDANDVLQNTFMKAWNGLDGFRGESQISTWLYRIAIKTDKSNLVAQGRQAPTTTEFDAEEAEGFEDAGQLRDINTQERLLKSKQTGDTINAAMEALPEELRNAIVLREIEGLSYEEIAGLTDVPVGTVRSRIFRAREAIAAKVGPLLEHRSGKRW